MPSRRGRPPSIAPPPAVRPPWANPPPPLGAGAMDCLAAALAARHVDRALVLTSFHQSPLPTALVLRMAGIAFVAAISEDYPGSLLDVRHRQVRETHEVERNLELAAAAGFAPPAGDDGRLALRAVPRPPRVPDRVVVHPGASVPARTWPPGRFAELAGALAAAGYDVVVTGSSREAGLVETVRAGAPSAQVVVGAGLAELAGGPGMQRKVLRQRLPCVAVAAGSRVHVGKHTDHPSRRRWTTRRRLPPPTAGLGAARARPRHQGTARPRRTTRCPVRHPPPSSGPTSSEAQERAT